MINNGAENVSEFQINQLFFHDYRCIKLLDLLNIFHEHDSVFRVKLNIVRDKYELYYISYIILYAVAHCK